MRISKWMSMGVGMCLGMLLLAGCAGNQAAQAPSDEELIEQLKQTCLEAAAAADTEALLALFSEDFDNSYLGNKQAFANFLDMAKGQGYIDGIVIDMDSAELTLEEGRAELYPVSIEGSFGAVTAGFLAEKRDGQWLITGMDLEL